MTTETAPSPTPASGGRGARGRGARGPGLLSRIATYYREIVAELRKVIYPSRQVLLTYTTVVLVFVIFMTALVSLLDYGLSKAVLAVFG